MTCKSKSQLSRNRTLVLFLILMISLLFQGCSLNKRATLAAHICPAAPPELIDPIARQNAIDRVRNATTNPTPKDVRDDLVNGIAITITNNYQNYKGSIYVGRASFDTLSDFSLLTLTGITAVAGSAATKAALGAASAGVTGARSSANLNFFNNVSRDTIFTVLDSLSNKQLQTIRSNLSTSDVTFYRMSDALVDLQTLYNDGCILTAESIISGAAGQANANTIGNAFAAPAPGAAAPAPGAAAPAPGAAAPAPGAAAPAPGAAAPAPGAAAPAPGAANNLKLSPNAEMLNSLSSAIEQHTSQKPPTPPK